MDRLTALRVFVRVADEGSFSAAANVLEISAPMVTRYIADLEQWLRIRLLHRSTRRLSLTSQGQQYLMRVRSILKELDEADIEVAKDADDLSGPIHVASSSVLSTFVLAPAIARFCKRYPGATFHLHVSNDDALVIEDHDITLLNVDPGFDSTQVARKIISTDTVLLASPDYVARHGIAQRPLDLDHHRYLAFTTSDARYVEIKLGLRNKDGSEAEVNLVPAMWSNQVETLIKAAHEGAGIVALTSSVATAQISKGELVRVLPDWTTGPSLLYAALPSRKFIPLRVQLFLDFLADYCRGRAGQREQRDELRPRRR